MQITLDVNIPDDLAQRLSLVPDQSRFVARAIAHELQAARPLEVIVRDMAAQAKAKGLTEEKLAAILDEMQA